MRKLILSYFIILITALISIIAIPVLAQEIEVEKALLEFNNKFLPGVDNYQTQIKYPKSSDYYFKWASLVIAVGGDTAFILTAGHSETVVKIVDATILGGEAVQGKVAEAAVDFAVGEAVDYGLKKAVGKKIPGYRSGVAVYGILKAGAEEQEKVFESIAKQKEIQEFIGETAPAAVELQKKIKSIESPDKRKEYQEMLSAMLEKRAKLSVYREMQFDKNEANIGGLEYEILYSINPVMAAQFADGKLTSSWQLSNSAKDYAAGRINKYQLIEHIKDYMRSNHGNEPLSYTENMMDKRLKAIQGKLDEIDKAYEAINKYGGSTAGDIKEVSSYKQLKIVIPKAYRMVANLDVRELLKVPDNFKSSEPNQGTTQENNNLTHSEEEIAITSMINNLFAASDNQDWEQMKKYCLPGSQVYLGLEEAQNNTSKPTPGMKTTSQLVIDKINVNNFTAVAYCSVSTIMTFNGKNIRKDDAEATMFLEKVDNKWKLSEVQSKIINTIRGSGSDYIKILSVTPDSGLIDGVNTDFEVVVEYKLVSSKRGGIDVSFNNGKNPNNYYASTRNYICVDKGSGTHIFNVSEKPKNWGSLNDFKVCASLGVRGEKCNYGLGCDYKILNFN